MKVEGKSVVAGDLQIKIACNPEYCNQAKGFLVSIHSTNRLTCLKVSYGQYDITAWTP